MVNKQTMGAAVKTESHIPPTTQKKNESKSPPKKKWKDATSFTFGRFGPMIF